MTCRRPDLAEAVARLALEFDLARRELWSAVGLLPSVDAEPGELRARDDNFEASTPRAVTHETAALLQRAVSARHRLVEANVPLARALAKGRHDARELAAAGNLALYKAADRFDPARGAGFATCAKWWIRKAFQASERAARPVSSTEHAVRAGRAAQVVDVAALETAVGDGDPEEALIDRETRIEQAARIEQLQAALDRLDPTVRRILLGEEVEGLPASRSRTLAAAGRRALARALGVDPESKGRAYRGTARALEDAQQRSLFDLDA